MINWTLTEDAVPTPGGPPGATYCEIAGDTNDPHDNRYYPDRLSALNFLIGHKMQRNDTLHVAGASTGTILRIGMVKVGDAIEYDVGSVQLPNPAALIEWLNTNLKAGDTLTYLPTTPGP